MVSFTITACKLNSSGSMLGRVTLAFCKSCRFITTKAEGTNVRWFYASDVPIRKPFEPTYSIGDKEPQKFIPFSKNDSMRLERMFQLGLCAGSASNLKQIMVNEDHLFEVDLARKEMKPAYWEGPVYEVRRGLWFNSEHVPVRSDLASELEKHRQEFLADKSKHQESNNVDGEQGYRDVFSLSKKYKEGKMVLYADEQTAFVVPELYGGKMQLNWLRSNLAQAVQFGAYRVVRGVEADSSLTASVKKNVASEVQGTSKSLGKMTDLINWQIFGLLTGLNPLNSSKDSTNKVMEREVETDYTREKAADKEWRSNHRDVDHLVFCIHGIGQNLGKKYQYVNFAHTVNILRNNIKKMYSSSDKLKQVSKDNGHADWDENCRTQVIPITWRNKIGFNTDDLKVNTEDPDLPTLSDITVDGVKPLRKVLGDVVLDLLLYGESHYKHRILQEVAGQLNHLYSLYRARNPNFDGKVHILSHSLGSLLAFDILSNQDRYPLDFEVENFFSVGSPIGVFKLIQKTKIGHLKASSTEKVEHPQCQNFFNIFHVCDPVAYRVEPLIDRSFTDIQPAYVPHWTSNDITSKVLEIGGSLIANDSKKENSTTTMTDRQIQMLNKLNYSGRVDYSFLPNFLEVDLISAIKAHVSYFEDMDLAAFVLKQLLSQHRRVDTGLLAQKRSVVETD
ncbi:LANO_0H11320g1_1 [Lachancea nothofagi CBS 11611]|uniref:LANO_0H11320g1_1 n=1 Tax=Lachancea nothofagi CBS 11611 TaxID=1266666 RepID=A0A1G4KM30_9SACH|nr:LANO_0H11320g1_1 [Lachancea nothofagi CBS 11611]